MNARELLEDVGRQVLDISAGRYGVLYDRDDRSKVAGIDLPLRFGYTVEIRYDDWTGTYTVTRLFRRRVNGARRAEVKGERTYMQAADVPLAAWYASKFEDYDEDEWTAQR